MLSFLVRGQATGSHRGQGGACHRRVWGGGERAPLQDLSQPAEVQRGEVYCALFFILRSLFLRGILQMESKADAGGQDPGCPVTQSRSPQTLLLPPLLPPNHNLSRVWGNSRGRPMQGVMRAVDPEFRP